MPSMMTEARVACSTRSLCANEARECTDTAAPVRRHLRHDAEKAHARRWVVVLAFLFTMYANYRLGAGSRWAYRFILFATGIATAKFIFNVAINKSISSFQVVGFALNVAMLMLLLASASKAFYQRRN